MQDAFAPTTKCKVRPSLVPLGFFRRYMADSDYLLLTDLTKMAKAKINQWALHVKKLTNN